MECPFNRERRQVPCLLPSICEHREFSCEEDYQRTESSSKLLKTRLKRNAFSQRFEAGNDPEEERHLLSEHTQDSKFCDEECKPKLVKGWKMQRRKVKIAWAKSSGRRQSLRLGLRSSVKVLSPLFLLRTVRDAYVSVMTRLASKHNQRSWYSVGARAL